MNFKKKKGLQVSSNVAWPLKIKPTVKLAEKSKDDEVWEPDLGESVMGEEHFLAGALIIVT